MSEEEKTTIDTTKKYIDLFLKKEDLESELKRVMAEISRIEEGLLEYFQQHGISRIGVGKRTLFLRRQIYASLIDKNAAHAELKRHGYGDLVEPRVMPQRLSAWIRELLKKVEENDEDVEISSGDLADTLPLPQELKKQIRITEKNSVCVRSK